MIVEYFESIRRNTALTESDIEVPLYRPLLYFRCLSNFLWCPPNRVGTNEFVCTIAVAESPKQRLLDKVIDLGADLLVVAPNAP